MIDIRSERMLLWETLDLSQQQKYQQIKETQDKLMEKQNIFKDSQFEIVKWIHLE